MLWKNRPGLSPEQRFEELEKTLGIENIQDMEIDEENGFLFIYTDTKKFRITMTEV